jgi:hypothetical protein
MSKIDQLRALREAKSSRGGVESRHAGRQTQAGPRMTSDVKNGLAKPLSPNREQPLTSLAGVASGPREAKPGRPLDVDKAKTLTATKPWAAAGLSRRTWYRRRSEKVAQ